MLSGIAAIIIHYDIAFSVNSNPDSKIWEDGSAVAEAREEILEFAAVLTEIMRLCFGALIGALSMAWQKALSDSTRTDTIEDVKESQNMPAVTGEFKISD